MDELLPTIRIKEKFFNVPLIRGEGRVTNDAFSENAHTSAASFTRVWVVCGDLNERVREENIYL